MFRVNTYLLALLLFALGIIPSTVFANADSLKVFRTFDSVEFGGPGHIDPDLMHDTNPLSYFGINIKPGQKLNVHVHGVPGRTASTELTSVEVKVLNYQRQTISNLRVSSFKDPFAGDSFVAPGNTSGDDNRYFVLVDVEEGYAPATFSLDLNLDDVSDSNSGTDAPDTFENALPLTDELRGFLPVSNTYSTDNADVYTFDIPKNSTLSLDATPEDQGMVAIEIFDQDKRSITSYRPHNPGEINKIKISSKDSHKLYLKVTGEAGLYTIRHQISNATTDELKNAFDRTPSPNNINYSNSNVSTGSPSHTPYYLFGILVLAGIFIKYKSIIISFIEKFLDHN